MKCFEISFQCNLNKMLFFIIFPCFFRILGLNIKIVLSFLENKTKFYTRSGLFLRKIEVYKKPFCLRLPCNLQSHSAATRESPLESHAR